jgi:hypothetical protein
VFAALITYLSLSGFVVNTALSTYWIAAWPQQLGVLDDIRHALPTIMPGTTLILHDVCPYIGPAIVFESDWDLAGALQVMYRDPTLRADVTMGDFSIGEDGLWTRIYDRKPVLHRYGPNLLLFSGRQQTAVTIPDVEVARSRLSFRTGCPQGSPGQGTVALPIDVLYQWAERKGFRPWRRTTAVLRKLPV